MDLDFHALLGYVRRWWWLAVGLPLLTAALVYVIVSRQTPLYMATSILTVKPASTGEQQSDPTRGSDIAQTYQELVRTQEVLQPVAERLGGDFTVGVLKGVVTATAPTNKFLLKISATDADPEQAALIANEVAEEFENYVQRGAEEELNVSLTSLDALIADRQADVAAQQQAIDDLTASNGSQEALVQARNQLSSLQTQLLDAQTRGEELRTTGALQQAQVRLSAQAQVPGYSFAPRTRFYTILGLLMGVALAGGMIVLLEYLDNTVKPQLDFAEMIGAPLMAVVPSAQKRFLHGNEQLFMRSQAGSTMAESIRLLRTNIEFAAAAKEISTLTVTSSEPSEGKSTVTANLATGMSQTGFTVAVIDADMRRPNQHRIFGVANTVGLTTLLTRDVADWKSAAHEVADNLWLISSGPIPPNPADLLSSDRFRHTLDLILASVDVVLIDTPPLLVVSDPLVVATKTDATLLISRSGTTRIETLRRSASVLHQNGIRLIGVALNLETGRSGPGYYYYYNSEYYTNPAEPTLEATKIPAKSLAHRPDHAA